jgi:hypothetical protein
MRFPAGRWATRTNPKPGDVDRGLSNAAEQQQLHKAGKPVVQQQRNLSWLTKMSLAAYHIESAVGGGSTLSRYVLAIQRPRAAVTVAPPCADPRAR